MDIDNLYLFTGSEEPVIKTKINRLVDELKKTSSEVTKYDLEIINLRKVISDAITIPFLTEQKIFILRNPKLLASSTETPEMKEFINYLKKSNPTTIIIIDATGIDIKSDNPLYRVLMKQAVINDVKRLEDIELSGIVIRKLSINDVTIKDDALRLLLTYLNHNLVRTEHEIEKLSSYAGNGGTITIDDVKLLVSKDLDDDIFSLARAVMSKNRQKVLEIYHELSLQTNDTLGLLGMLSKAFTELLIASKLLLAGYSNQDIATTCNINKGRAYYLVQDAKNFNETELSNYITALADLDYKIKTGSINKYVGLELLLLKL